MRRPENLTSCPGRLRHRCPSVCAGAAPSPLILTPHGAVRLDGSGETTGNLDAPTARRIRDAFTSGHGSGLFHLGAVEATSALPPVAAFWRNFGRVFMTALCGVSDIDQHRDTLRIPIPSDAMAALIEAAPPMIGGEYLSGEVLEDLWVDMEAACRAQLKAFDGPAQEFLRRKNPVWNLVGRVHFHLYPSRTSRIGPAGPREAGCRRCSMIYTAPRPTRSTLTGS